MIEGIGLIALGVLMLLLAPLRHYHHSWRSPWQVASWGLLAILTGFVACFLDVWWL